MEKQAHAPAVGLPEYRHRYIILLIVLSGIFMGVLDTNVVNVAMPWLTASFGVDLKTSEWVITSYLVVNTSLLLIFGRVSEITGKAKLFLAGISLFTISSLACGLSTGINELILFRIIQGIGSSVVFSINTAILIQTFPRNERGRALGFVGTTVAIGSIAGPILGGFIVKWAGWPYIFFINVPIGIILVLGALKYLKIMEIRKSEFDMDWVGAAALIASVVSLMLLLNSLADCEYITTGMYANLGIFLLSLAAFVYTELKHKNPIVDLSVFGVKNFTFANLSTMINFIAFSIFTLTMPFFLEIVFDYKPDQVGTFLLILPAVMAIISPLSGWIYDKLQSTYHSSFGMLVMAAGLFGLSFAIRSPDVIPILACIAIFGFGSGLFTSPNNTEVMSALPIQKSTIASSTLATVRNFGNSIGVSIASILLYMQLRSCGFNGPLINAVPSDMIQAAGSVFMVGGALCIVGIFTSLMLRWNRKPAKTPSK
jgi:EmrB/QacA subfamily drug resistance transporter